MDAADLNSVVHLSAHSRAHACQRDDVRLVRRITVLLDLLGHQVSVEVLSARWRLSPSCLYHWRQAFLLWGAWTAWSIAMAGGARS